MHLFRTSTAKVAEKANISQPYIFKFFSSKELLLQEALKVSWTRIQTSFLQVIESASARNLEENLILAYTEIMKNNENEILLQMQAQTIREENIVKVMKEELMKVHSIVLNAFKSSGIK